MTPVETPGSWHSYPSIYQLGHKALEHLLEGDVQVEEKVDGSQFSACRTEDGTLLVRSKGAVMLADAPERMFAKAVESAQAMPLHPGWTYRFEYLAKPKHNTLAYDRVPKNHLILFDVNNGHESYLCGEHRQQEADRIGVECVPILFSGPIRSIDRFLDFLDTPSVLGGQKIEGVVVKPVGYDLFGPDKKVLMGKFVSEAFKESHAHAWREANPHSGDILERLTKAYTSEARWAKAVQHLRERGELEGSPRDIGKLIREIPEDVLKECEAEIKDKLFAWAWEHIRRGLTRGMPEWFKEQLLREQFKTE